MASNSPRESNKQKRTPVLPDMTDIRFLLESGLHPRDLIRILAPEIEIPADADLDTVAQLFASLFDTPKRKKLAQYNTLDDSVELIRKSRKIIVLSGAGISTSAGLPDFRSRNGIYRQIHEQHQDLRDPKLMFDIIYFRKNPQPFYHFAKALFPGQFEPTIGHHFIKSIEEHGKLLNNYTQNIDTLERQAGIKRVVECHGSFSKATCTSCKYSLDGEYLRKDIFNQRIPTCPLCHTSDDGPQDGLGIMKPNIVFFGESLGNNFHETIERDKDQVDLLIVIGSSLKVRPVALLPTIVPPDVPQILINREPLDQCAFDIELIGNCDEIVQEICLRLGNSWSKICLNETKLMAQKVGLKWAQPKEPDDDQDKYPKDVGRCNERKNEATSSQSSEENNPGPSGRVTRANVKKEEVMDVSSASESSRAQLDANKSTNEETDESDWIDVEDISDSGSDSEMDYVNNKVDLVVPQGSFVFVEPNKHIFTGAEMTRAQYQKLRDSIQ